MYILGEIEFFPEFILIRERTEEIYRIEEIEDLKIDFSYKENIPHLLKISFKTRYNTFVEKYMIVEREVLSEIYSYHRKK